MDSTLAVGRSSLIKSPTKKRQEIGALSRLPYQGNDVLLTSSWVKDQTTEQGKGSDISV